MGSVLLDRIRRPRHPLGVLSLVRDGDGLTASRFPAGSSIGQLLLECAWKNAHIVSTALIWAVGSPRPALVPPGQAWPMPLMTCEMTWLPSAQPATVRLTVYLGRPKRPRRRCSRVSGTRRADH